MGSIQEADRHATLFAILVARQQDEQLRIAPKSLRLYEIKPVFAPIAFALGGIEFELHVGE